MPDTDERHPMAATSGWQSYLQKEYCSDRSSVTFTGCSSRQAAAGTAKPSHLSPPRGENRTGQLQGLRPDGSGRCCNGGPAAPLTGLMQASLTGIFQPRQPEDPS